MNKRDVPGYWAAGFLATAVAMIVAACGGGEATATRPASPQATRPPATAVPRATAVATSTPAPAATPTPAVTAIPAGRQPRYGGVLRLRDIRDWAAWDSYNALSGFVPWYSNVLNGLVFYDQDDVTRLIPDAAERWEVSADGKTVTFFLRKDMNWQDGRPFTADDVVYNLERGRKGEGRVNFNRRRLEQVDQVQKVDDKTVKVTLKRASASFMDGMGTVYMMMYPAHVPDMQVFKERPVGTGAFQFKRWQQDTILELAKSPAYYKKDAAGRQLPYLDGLEIYPITSPANALASFRAGRLDCGCFYDQDWVTANKTTLEKDTPGLKTWVAQSNAFSVVFNIKRKPYDNRDVREAFSAAIDRREMAKFPRAGLAHYPPNNMLSPELGGKWGLPEAEIQTYPGYRDRETDRAYSQALFRRVGIDPRSMTIDIPGTLFYREYFEAFEPQIASTGAKTRLNVEDGAAAQQRFTTNGDFDITISTGNGSLLDPADVFLDWLKSNGTRNPGKVISHPDFERLAEEQDVTLDPVRRLEIVRNIQRVAIKEVLFAPVIYEASAWANQPTINGFPAPRSCCGPHMRLDRVWKDS